MSNKAEFCQNMQLCADLFRLSREAEANKYLAELFEPLAMFMQAESGPRLEFLQQLISALMTAQQRRDLLYLADLLEFELKPLYAE